MGQKQLTKAETTLKEGIRLHPNSQVFQFNLGSLYYSFGRPLDAKPYLWNAIELGWPKPDPFMALGSIYESEGNLDSARVAYEQAVQKYPDFTPARAALQKLRQNP